MNPPSEPTPSEKQHFYAAMEPKWQEIATALAADRPPEWEGYRFQADILPAADQKQFQIQACFGDRVSNRQRGGTPKDILDKVAELHVTYTNFWAPMAWKKVEIEQIWNREKKSWSFEMKWEY